MTNTLQKINQTFINMIPDRALYWVTILRAKFQGESELRILSEIVPLKQAAVDIGANRGIYSHFLSQLCPLVYAFEPNPAIAAFLRRNVSVNVIVSEVALSNKVGTSTLSIPVVGAHEAHGYGRLAGAFGGGNAAYTVALDKLDNQEIEGIGFIKIDVEGHEIYVLQGAIETIKKYRPVILIEIEQRHIDFDARNIFSYLEELGYEGKFYYGGKFNSVKEFSFTQLQAKFLSEDGSKILSRKQYVNNFVFVPLERLDDFPIFRHAE